MLYTPNQIRIGSITTSEKEIKDLVKAWIAISIAFGIVFGGSIISGGFYIAFVISSLTVGIGFLLHELGHKFVAQRYGCFAEFRSFDRMLVLAIIMSFFGFVLVAPGAVMISGPVGIRRNGKISIAGPIVNLVLASLFLASLLTIEINLVRVISFYGFIINTWLALFNMIPLWNFDGAKILRWSKVNYGIVVAISLVFMLLRSYISL